VGEIKPDECGADEGGAEKCASYQLQKVRVPKLKGLQYAGDNENPQGNPRDVFSMRHKEEYDQAPKDLVKQSCAVIVEPYMAGAGVEFE